METKPHALASEETSNSGLALCNQEVAIAQQCNDMETKVADPKEEEAVACDQGVANAKQCEEMEPKGAVAMKEEGVARDQSVANANQCKEVVPEIAVPMEEEGMVACVQRVAIAKQCKEMEPLKGAVPRAEEVVACAQGDRVAIAKQCKEMEPKVADPMEKEVVACDQGVANSKQCKEMEPKDAVSMEEEAVSCAQGVANTIADQCNEMEPIGAIPKAEPTVAYAQGVAIAEQCKEMVPEVAVLPMEEEADLACDQRGMAIAKQCNELNLEVAIPVEVEADLACAQGMVPRMAKLCKELDPENDVYLTIEDCSGELPNPLTAANGDGDGGKNIVNGIKVCIGSQEEIPPPAEEVLTERGLVISEPPVENLVAPEPSWGDVPDESVTVPVAVETRHLPKRPRPAPENVEVDDVVQTMRSILMDLRNVDDARLHPDDDAKVRSLLEYHPQAQEKMGSGIDYIKIKRHSTFKDARCFWVVRTDGTETDFSYHKCLKEKVAKDHPNFVDRYDAVYRAPKRPRQA